MLSDLTTSGHHGRFYPFGACVAAEARAGARLPLIHHSDQRLQCACQDYTDLLSQRQIQISMAAVSKPEETGFAERLMRTIKEEKVDLAEYRDLHDAYRRIGQFLDHVYTRKRNHSALGYLTPAEFEDQWRHQQLAAVS